MICKITISLLLLCSLAFNANAATKTWDGGGGDNNWTTAANWDSDIAPVAGDALVFAGSTRTSPSNDFAAATSFVSITFSSGASAFTLSGNSVTLSGGASAITASNTSLTMTIGINIIFGTAAPTITSTSGGTLNISGTITNGGFLVTVACDGTSTFSGVISGTGGLTKSGAGTLTLSGANTYTGDTKISAGTISASAENNLGAPSGANFIEFTGDGTLAVSASFSTTKEVIANGASRSITINVTGGQTFTQTGALRAYNGTNPPVYKTGTGTWIQGGDGGWTDGGINIQGGTMEGRLANSFGDNGNDQIYLSAGVTIRLVSDAGVAFAPSLTLSGAGTSIVVDRVSGGAGVTHSLNTLTVSGAYTVSISAGSNVTSGTAGCTFRGTTTLNGATIIDVTDPGAPDILATFTGNMSGTNTNLTVQGTGNSTISGVIGTGTGTLTKAGTGTLLLGGDNTYSGATTISAGTVKLDLYERIPDNSALTLNGTLDLNGWEETVPSITGSGTIDIVSAGGSPNFNVGSDNTSTTFSGVIQNTTGTITLIKYGTGTLTLSGASSYTGQTQLAAGAFSISAENNLGAHATELIRFTGNTTLYITSSFSTAREVIAQGAARSITVNVAAAQTFTQTGALRAWAGSGGVYKTGTGTWIQGGDGSFVDGGVYVQAGTMEFRVNNGWGDAATDQLYPSAGTTVRLVSDAGVSFIGSLTVNGTGANLVADRLTGGAGNTHSINNLVMDGAYTLNVSAGSNVTSGTNNITVRGTTTLNGNSTIDVTDPGAPDILTTLTGNVSGAGMNLTIQGSGNTTIAGVIGTTTGTLTKAGTGTLIISGANTYTGATTVSAGTLKLGASGVISNSSAVTVTGILDMNTYSETIGSLAGAGTVDNVSGGGTPTLTTGADNTSTTFSGVIQNTSGVIALTKSGSGTFTLSGTNTYTGATTTSAGILQLGAAGVISNSSNFLAAGGTFSTGAAAGYSETVGTLTLNANTKIALGTGAHNLNFAASDGTSWTGGTLLRITGWQGAYNCSSGTSGKIYTGSSAELSAGKLAQIFFSHPISALPYTACQLSDGEIVPTGTLPVKLIFFDGKLVGTTVQLQWITASEINSDYFEVLRSSDGVNFESIGKVNATGNSVDFLSYVFVDSAPLNGINYYKLVQYDFDGAHEEFNIVAIDNTSSDFKISALYPNPASSFISINFQTEQQGTVNLFIYDALGRTVYSAPLASIKGENKFIIPLNNLSNGNYFVRITNSNNEISGKQIIVR